MKFDTGRFSGTLITFLALICACDDVLALSWLDLAKLSLMNLILPKIIRSQGSSLIALKFGTYRFSGTLITFLALIFVYDHVLALSWLDLAKLNQMSLI